MPELLQRCTGDREHRAWVGVGVLQGKYMLGYALVVLRARDQTLANLTCIGETNKPEGGRKNYG